MGLRQHGFSLCSTGIRAAPGWGTWSAFGPGGSGEWLDGELLSERMGGDSLGAQGGERQGVVAFGEALAVFVEDQAVVVVMRDGESEECLQQAVDVSGGQQVFTAGDQGDALKGVVGHDRQMVGGGEFLAGENHVA